MCNRLARFSRILKYLLIFCCFSGKCFCYDEYDDAPFSDDLKLLAMLPDIPQVGTTISLQGFTPRNAYRFTINLQKDLGYETNDIALHFDVRFKDRFVVRNYLKHEDGWEDYEERDGIMPFKAGEVFTIDFIMYKDFIRIKVNGKDFTKYKHRLPFEDISFVRISRDVVITSIKFT